MTKSILGSGLLAVDHIFLAEEKGRSPKKIKYLGSAGGGSIPNTLCLLSLLGYKTYIFGLTGNDESEKIIKNEFRLFGVNYDNLIKRGDRKDFRLTRQFSHLILLDGTHRFKKYCLSCGTKFNRNYNINKSDFNYKIEKLADTINLLLLDRANEATLSLAKMIKKHERKIAYDLSFSSYGPYFEKIKSIIELCDLVKVNDKTFQKIMGSNDNASIMRWRENYPDIDYLLVTNSEKGVYGYANINNKRTIFHFNAIPYDHVKDTSGAGDIFFAIVASELLLKKPPSTLEEFKRKIDLGQALASLNCTLYGARALQRTFLNQKVSSKEILNSANFIRERGKAGNSFSPAIGLPKPISEPYRLSKLNGCNICGSISMNKRMKINLRLRRSTSLTIHKSLISAPWTMKTSFELGKTYRNNIQEIRLNNALLVGSGGSFSASIFGEILYLHSLGKLAKAITPFEFEGLNKIDSDTIVWFISHGGSNTDILGAALYAKEIEHSKSIILTGNKNSKLADLANQYKWKKIFIQSQERNFVSIIGFLSQISALSAILATNEELEKLDEFFSEESLRSFFNSSIKIMKSLAYKISNNSDVVDNIHIVGLARGWGWPALIDLESKIIEGGICTIEMAELKNFTHGRYINTFGRKNRYAILMKTPSDAELVNYIVKRFKRRVPYSVLQTDKNGIIGSIELIIKSIFLAYYLGQIAKKDILKPKYPPEAKGLYSWEPEYRKGFWKEK